MLRLYLTKTAIDPIDIKPQRRLGLVHTNFPLYLTPCWQNSLKLRRGKLRTKNQYEPFIIDNFWRFPFTTLILNHFILSGFPKDPLLRSVWVVWLLFRLTVVLYSTITRQDTDWPEDPLLKLISNDDWADFVHTFQKWKGTLFVFCWLGTINKPKLTPWWSPW